MSEAHEQSGGRLRRRARFQMRMPGFVDDRVIGLGDVVSRATSTVGLRPCGGCVRRADRLNQVVVFTGGRSRRGRHPPS